MNPEWQETTVDGARTRRWSIDVKQCPDLAEHHIAWLGLDTVYAPYRRVRLSPSGSFLLACLEGEGRVLLEGREQRVTAGQLCLAPPRVLNAFHAVPGKPWVFAWVRYHEPLPLKPLVGAGSPRRIDQGADDLGRTIQGLRTEWEGERDASQTADKLGAVLRISGGTLWQFRTSEGTLEIEESLWVDGDGRPYPTEQLVVTGSAPAGGASIGWIFKHIG